MPLAPRPASTPHEVRVAAAKALRDRIDLALHVVRDFGQLGTQDLISVTIAAFGAVLVDMKAGRASVMAELGQVVNALEAQARKAKNTSKRKGSPA